MNINWNVSRNKYFMLPASDNLLPALQPAIYEVDVDPNLGFHLVRKYDSYPLPSDIYNFNNTEIKSDLPQIFLNRFSSESNNLGIMLIGEKGTGKSLLMKRTANLALSLGMPVITVENSFNSETLANFLSSIKEPCVVLFDEFEKKYDPDPDSENRPSQAGLLSFFDGTSIHRKLIIVTANDRDSINEFFLNRPSRIRYVIDYLGLTDDFIHQYLTDHLQHPEAVQPLMDELSLVPSVNFDLLRNVVEEVNLLYPTESVKAIITILNIKRDDDYIMYYEMTASSEDNSIQIESDFIRLDWDDINSEGRDWVSFDDVLCRKLRNQYEDPVCGFHLFKESINQIKGRNHFTVQGIVRLDAEQDVPFVFEFRRILFNKKAL